MDGGADDLLAALIAENERRRQESEAPAQVDPEEARRTRFGEIAAQLRAHFHGAQCAFFAPGWTAAELISPTPVTERKRHARKRAACTTRQSGKTSGGNRETLARCLEARRRWVYCISTRAEAIKRAWRNDSEEGWVDLIRRYGLKVAENRRKFDAGIGDVLINETLLTIEFRNGSQLDIFASDDEKSADKLRGVTKDGIWVDEAQQFPFLTRFVNAVALPALAKRDGDLWLTGTPNEFNDGLFFDVTRDDDLSARLPGWDVHAWSVLDNPGFGATREERYERAIGHEIRESKLDPNNLPASFIREWFGKWVTTSARWVYRLQHLSDADLCYAPLRLTDRMPIFTTPDARRVDLGAILRPLLRPGEHLTWYDHERAVEDLPVRVPGTKRMIEWRYGLGSDFGYRPHPFAWVLWAWSEQMPGLYEMHSWKRTELLPDYQRDILLWLWLTIPGIDYVIGDPGGQQGANLEQWRILTGLPIEDAQKAAKPTYIEMFNGEIAAGRIRYRIGSPLLHEQRHLMWHQVGKKLEEHADRRLVDGTVPGNDCSDAGLYSFRPVIGRRTGDPPPPPPEPGTPEHDAWQERRQEAAVDRADVVSDSHDDDPPASVGWEHWG